MMPYSIVIAQISIFKPNKRNEIQPIGAQLQGVRKAAFSKALDISVLKDKLKKKKVSINDYIVVVAALAAAQIAVTAKFMQVSIPFTLKDYPSSISKLKIGNDFACLPFRLGFLEDRSIKAFPKMLRNQQRQVRDSNTIFLGLGFYYMMKYFVGLLRQKMVCSP